MWALTDEEWWEMDSTFQYHAGTKIGNNFGTNLMKISETGGSETGEGVLHTPKPATLFQAIKPKNLEVQTLMLYFYKFI